MSLQVWLPLNGNLENKGLRNVIASSTGTTINDSGKIGKCYKIGTSASSITIPKEAMNDFTDACSVVFWIKINSWNTSYATFFQAGPSGTAWTTYVFGFLRNNAASTCCFTISNGSSASNASYLTSTLSLGIWYHIVLTYETGKCKIYLNGQLDNEYSTSIVPKFSNITTISAGRCTNGSSYQTDCYLNDLRIYDHCLSAKEVKELSKGLVLHYKLDEPNVNLLHGIPKLTATNSYNAYQLQMTENLVAGQTYTLQLWDVDVSHSEKTVAQTGVWVYWGGGSVHLFNWAGSTYFTNGHADHLSYTFTVTSANASGSGATNSWFNIYNSVGYVAGTMSLTIGAWKLEKGSNATAATLTANEINANSVYDSSGYGNEGSVVGTSSKNPDTPKYRSSIYMSNSGTTNHVEVNNAITIDNSQITVSFWTNVALSRSQVVFADNNLSIEFGILSGVAYLYPPSSKTGFTTSHYVDGQWNHIVTIKNGTSYYLYINGQQESAASSSNYYIHNTKLWLLNRSYNTTYAAIGGVSDFRIYSTVLSEADILDLYHTSASVDDDGNVYAREVVEK